MCRYIAFLFPILLLTACGSGSSDQSESPPPAPAAVTLGNRAVPGYLLQVDCNGDLTPAAQRSIILNLKPDAGQLAPATVEAAVGSNELNDWVAGIPDEQHLRWTWNLTLPSDLADQRVWLRLTDTDGNTSQSGLDDFSLVK